MIKYNNFEGKAHALITVVCSLLTCSMVFFGVVTRLFEVSVDVPTITGMLSFRFFTVLSNLFAMFTSLLYVPYGVDGIRNHNFHIPKWIIYVSYMSTTGVAITFLVALFILSPATSFYRMLLEGPRLFLHLLGPLCAMIQFLFVNTSHRIDFKYSFLALAPVLIYAVVYLINVVYLEQWDDQYRFNTVVPWYISALIILPLTFLIATLLRVIHNHCHAGQTKEFQSYYLSSPDYACGNIEDAIAVLARNRAVRGISVYGAGGVNLIIPVRELHLLAERYHFTGEMPQLYEIYVKKYCAAE